MTDTKTKKRLLVDDWQMTKENISQGVGLIRMGLSEVCSTDSYYKYKDKIKEFRGGLPRWLSPYVWDVRPNRREFLLKFKDGREQWMKAYEGSRTLMVDTYRELIRGGHCERRRK